MDTIDYRVVIRSLSLLVILLVSLILIFQTKGPSEVLFRKSRSNFSTLRNLGNLMSSLRKSRSSFSTLRNLGNFISSLRFGI